jgi:glycerol uptake facilitator-like aquaporin
MPPSLGRRATAEAVGTGMLVAVVVGSGIAADRLTDDTALALLANAAATAGGLVALILTFSAISGAHINPVVTLAERLQGRSTTREAAAYISAQIGGAVAGVVVANLMFDLAPVTLSTQTRSSAALWLGEVVATFGLLIVILRLVRDGRSSAVPYAVAGYIAAGYWFTSSTSFANPAVTIGRTLTDTFTGIDPASAPAFVAAQLAGGALAVALARYLHADEKIREESLWPTSKS